MSWALARCRLSRHLTSRLALWSEFHGRVAELPEEERLVFELHYYMDLPLDEIAAAMGLTLSAVKSRLHRARALLRRLLVDEG